LPVIAANFTIHWYATSVEDSGFEPAVFVKGRICNGSGDCIGCIGLSFLGEWAGYEGIKSRAKVGERASLFCSEGIGAPHEIFPAALQLFDGRSPAVLQECFQLFKVFFVPSRSLAAMLGLKAFVGELEKRRIAGIGRRRGFRRRF